MSCNADLANWLKLRRSRSFKVTDFRTYRKLISERELAGHRFLRSRSLYVVVFPSFCRL